MTKLKAAVIRAVRTVAQTALALIGTAQFIDEVTWPAVVSGSLLAGLMSLLTSAVTDLPETP